MQTCLKTEVCELPIGPTIQASAPCSNPNGSIGVGGGACHMSLNDTAGRLKDPIGFLAANQHAIFTHQPQCACCILTNGLHPLKRQTIRGFDNGNQTPIYS